ncbi:MAG: hypothetical protein ACPW61_03260 [Methyloligella sp. ZOD6]
MGILWVRVSAAAFAATVLMSGSPSLAAEQEAGQVMAQQLTERTREPETGTEGSEDKLSDSAVRVMTSYAWSIMPDEMEGPSGGTIQLDKSDPAKFLIPVDDARGVIRAAMRSAYAEICELPELGQKNFRTMMDEQRERGIWSLEQMQFINTLHMFAVSYFTGDMKITEQEGDGAPAEGAASKATEGEEAFNPTRPTCTPEKKEAVTEAINEYLKAAEATQPSPPVSPESMSVPGLSIQTPQPAAPPPSASSEALSVPGMSVVPPRQGGPVAQPVVPNDTGAN